MTPDETLPLVVKRIDYSFDLIQTFSFCLALSIVRASLTTSLITSVRSLLSCLHITINYGVIEGTEKMRKLLVFVVVQALVSQQSVFCTGSYNVCDNTHH